MTSYTRARHIAIPEKSLFRLVSRHIVYWRISPPEDENAVYQDRARSSFLITLLAVRTDLRH